MRKSLIITVAILAISGLALTGCCGKLFREAYEEVEEAQTTSSAKFAGTYAVEGDGYTATLSIQKTGKGYHLKWDMPDGSAYYGKGLEMNEVLGVVFSQEAGSGAGVVAYKKAGDGITGLWVSAGGEQLFYEKSGGAATLRASSRELEGEYSITGTNTDGSTYEGKLNILATGEAWSAQWLTGGGEVYGSGMVADNVLVLGYGNEEGLGVAVYEIKASKLDGIWMFAEYAGMSRAGTIYTGTEKAKK